ncbi:hypothetical protein F4820DRAFT_443068 [Hypoxylon rubiginosum]|uniref:Uncharacterized protein n=1 Tax=Hypoxylon rubiginosum TaxID=110542 RepID=A0ACB9ZFV1_9PEZI|nr:hypothetical protein F4820DRAFT_443068 [Hypoxylon rubiginosum]
MPDAKSASVYEADEAVNPQTESQDGGPVTFDLRANGLDDLIQVYDDQGRLHPVPQHKFLQDSEGKRIVGLSEHCMVNQDLRKPRFQARRRRGGRLWDLKILSGCYDNRKVQGAKDPLGLRTHIARPTRRQPPFDDQPSTRSVRDPRDIISVITSVPTLCSSRRKQYVSQKIALHIHITIIGDLHLNLQKVTGLKQPQTSSPSILKMAALPTTPLSKRLASPRSKRAQQRIKPNTAQLFIRELAQMQASTKSKRCKMHREINQLKLNTG